MGLDAVTVFSTLAPISSFCLFFAPFPKIYSLQGKTRGSSDPEEPFVTYLCMITQAILWISYGYLHSNLAVTLSQLVCGCCGCYYLFIVFSYSSSKSKAEIIRYGGLCVAFSFFVLSFAVVNNEYGHVALDLVACLVTLALFVTPLSHLTTIWKKKDAASLDWNMTLVMVFNSLSWLFLGLLLSDPFLIVPNSLGVVCSIVQLAFKLYFPSRG